VIHHLHAFWNDLWPNTIAPSAWTLTAVIISHVKRTAQAERHHQELKQHVTAAQNTTPPV